MIKSQTKDTLEREKYMGLIVEQTVLIFHSYVPFIA